MLKYHINSSYGNEVSWILYAWVCISIKTFLGKEEVINMYYRKKTCSYLVSEVLGRKHNLWYLKECSTVLK